MKILSPWLLYGRWTEGPLNPLSHFIHKLILLSWRELLSLFTHEGVEDQACEVESSKKIGAQNWIWVSWLFNQHVVPFLTASIINSSQRQEAPGSGDLEKWLSGLSTELHCLKKGFSVALRGGLGDPVRGTQVLLPTWMEGWLTCDWAETANSLMVKRGDKNGYCCKVASFFIRHGVVGGK